MAVTQHIYSQNTIPNQVYQQGVARKPAGAVTQDITEMLIEQLDLDTGDVIETLTLEGTNLPHQPFARSVRQEALKFYYPGGPPDRRPTVQVIGASDEDIMLRGQLKATKIQSVQRRTDPSIISNIIERFTREGKPVRLQLGQYIKYALITQTSPKYFTNAIIDWEISFMILGDENPITGVALKRDEQILDKVIEAADTQDLAQAVRDFIMDIEQAKIEAGILGYDFDTKRGGILRFARDAAEYISELANKAHDVVDIIENFVEEVEVTAASLQKALLEVEGIRNRMYQLQSRLNVAFYDIKSAANISRQLAAWNVFSLLSGLANGFQNQAKVAEDAIRREQVLSVKQAYVVVEGDSWQSIASRFYGGIDRWSDLRDFNPGELVINRTILIPR